MTAPVIGSKLETEEEEPKAISDAFSLLLLALVGDQSELPWCNETNGPTPQGDGGNLQAVNEGIRLLDPAERQTEWPEVDALFEARLPGLGQDECAAQGIHGWAQDQKLTVQEDDMVDERRPDILPRKDEDNSGILAQKQGHRQGLSPTKAKLPDQVDGYRSILRTVKNQAETSTIKSKTRAFKGEGETTNKVNSDFSFFRDDSDSAPVFTTAVRSEIQLRQEALEAPTSEVSSRDLVKELVSKVKMVREKGETQLEIQLKPEYLGKLRLEFVYKEGKVSTHLITKNPQIRELLLGHLPKLRETLNQQSVLQENIDIDVFVDQQGLEQETSSQEYNEGKQQAFKPFPPKVKGNDRQFYSDVELAIAGLNYLI